MTKTLKNHTLWSRTYLYSPYKGVPPGGRTHAKIRGFSAWDQTMDGQTPGDLKANSREK